MSPETELARTSANEPASSPAEPVKFVVGPALMPDRFTPSTSTRPLTLRMA